MIKRAVQMPDPTMGNTRLKLRTVHCAHTRKLKGNGQRSLTECAHRVIWRCSRRVIIVRTFLTAGVECRPGFHWIFKPLDYSILKRHAFLKLVWRSWREAGTRGADTSVASVRGTRDDSKLAKVVTGPSETTGVYKTFPLASQ